MISDSALTNMAAMRMRIRWNRCPILDWTNSLSANAATDLLIALRMAGATRGHAMNAMRP